MPGRRERMRRDLLSEVGGGPGASQGASGVRKGEQIGRAARPPPYLYFMPVPRPVLSRRTPGGAGGRGTTAVRALGPDPPPPGGFPCTPPTGPPLPPPAAGRGPHRRSSLFRLRRFCSVHAMDTCMPAAHGEGAPRGREGRKPGSPRADGRVQWPEPRGARGGCGGCGGSQQAGPGPRGRAAGGRGCAVGGGKRRGTTSGGIRPQGHWRGKRRGKWMRVAVQGDPGG